ncbi:hypothetical protein Pelo_7457 [Pelomyxa schiedti]|nr:hypothetical protein Pelo_7457 [Pelomyxa schiedti]
MGNTIETPEAQPLAEGSESDQAISKFRVKLSPTELEQLNKLWAERVGPATDKVDLGQFQTLASEAAHIFPELLALNEPAFVTQLFGVLDVDHSNSISHSELLGGLAILSKGTDIEKARLVFHIADKNGDGNLTKAELVEVMTSSVYNGQLLVCLKSGLSRDESERAWEATKTELQETINTAVSRIFDADDNNDGVLSEQEWINHCNSNTEIASLYKFCTGQFLEPASTSSTSSTLNETPLSKEELTAAAHKGD